MSQLTNIKNEIAYIDELYLKGQHDDGREALEGLNDRGDIDWLIEQAARVEVLEANLTGATELLDETIASYEKSVNQNARLREALEEMGRVQTGIYWNDIQAMKKIARIALEETK